MTSSATFKDWDKYRFPKNNIKAAFEDIREVIEREGVLSLEAKGNEAIV